MCKNYLALLSALFLLISVRSAFADGLVFDYKDPKEISAVSLTLESKLEPIFGFAKGITGKMKFDPANPKATTGKIAVDVSSIVFANDGYTQTARNYALEQDKFPQIFFTLKKVISGTKPSPNVYKGMVLADFTCHGITVPMIVPVTASYFPGLAKERTNGKYNGDVLVIRSSFNIDRSKFEITKEIPASMVGETIEVRVSCVGIHYAPGQKLPFDEVKPKLAVEKKTTANTLWKMEVEDRDNPMKVEATLNLSSDPPKIAFATVAGSLDADNIRIEGNKASFHLPNNPVVGETTGFLQLDGDRFSGELLTKAGPLKFHSRLKTASDDAFAPVTPSASSGMGKRFADLKLIEDGTNWSLSERMKYHHVPAVSIARIENFKVVETLASGVSNVETGEFVDENTLFQAGGMGSPLVNLLAFKLAAQGKLDLDREVNSYLKSSKIPENANTKNRKVRVLDLLNGTSGLTQYKFRGYRYGLKVPSLTDLLNGHDPIEMEPLDVKNEPGTKFQGGGVQQAVLQQVIEDATGLPLPTLMNELIFKPFGMKFSRYDVLPTASASQKVALGHYSTGELMLDLVHAYPACGESGLWTTAGDFALALCQIQLMLVGKPNLVLPEEKRDLLKLVDNPNWFLGLIKHENGDSYHGGDSYGFFANHKTNLANGSSVVVMANRVFSWQINNELISAIQKRNPAPAGTANK